MKEFVAWLEGILPYLIVVAGVLGLTSISAFIGVIVSENVACFVGELLDTRTEGKKETLKFLGWVISGVIAFFGLLAINRRATALDEANELTRRELSQERLKAAIDHLSNTESASGRIASFYELFNLARTTKRGYAKIVLDILCAHLRHISNDEKSKQELTERQTLINILFSLEAVDIFDKLYYDLQGIKLPGFDFRNMYKPKGKVNFSNANLSGAIFDNGIDLSGSIFQKTKLRKTILWGVNLQGADLRYADLRDTEFFRADFKGAVLVDADLRGTYLGKATGLENAILGGAKYDEGSSGKETIFPDGFKPEDHGMKLCSPDDDDE